ncbi:type II secretion system protein [Sporichthya sp.]|uniref:type II secretion system protein n=1 Tax=Sporichthya sp. TaxID=65475 RepID=UPI0025E9E1A6|nr:type II secretion system protein [Sporichthya sp.]
MRVVTPPIESRHTGAGGFTLIELCMAMSIFGLLAAISVGGLKGWTQAREHAGTAAAVQSLLREAQQRAVTEGRATCVTFDVGTQAYTMYRGACDDPARVVLETRRPDAARVRLAAPAFLGPSGPTPGVTFKPRGTAWPGSVQVTRTGSAKVYTLSVEGLTGRVSRA